MVLKERNQGPKVIIEVEGRIDAKSALDLDAVLQKMIQGITVEVVLDFSKTTFIASMGLRVLLTVQKRLKEKQGQLRIINLSPAVRDIFVMTNMIALFVHDEKLVVIQKTSTIGDFSLSGCLDVETLPILIDNIKNAEEGGIIDLSLDCGGLRALSNGAFQYIWETRERLILKQGSLSIQNMPESLKPIVRDCAAEEIFEQRK